MLIAENTQAYIHSRFLDRLLRLDFSDSALHCLLESDIDIFLYPSYIFNHSGLIFFALLG